MGDDRRGSAVGKGFGFGLGGCLGLIAIPFLVLFLGLKSCSDVVRDARLKAEADADARATAAAAIPAPTAADITFVSSVPSRSGRKINVDVTVRNDSKFYLILANVECDLFVGKTKIGRVPRGVQQMLPGDQQTMKHWIDGVKQKGDITSICAVTKVKFGSTANRTVE